MTVKYIWVMRMILYHGSKYIVEQPQYGKGKKNNDYGIGFYCTASMELAKEWACDDTYDGYANIYEIDEANLNILRLNNKDYLVPKKFRDLKARREYLDSNRSYRYSRNDLYMLDILRQEVKPDDSRLF